MSARNYVQAPVAKMVNDLESQVLRTASDSDNNVRPPAFILRQGFTFLKRLVGAAHNKPNRAIGYAPS